VQAGVEASEGADVLLILPGHLLGFTLQVRGRKGTNGRISVGYFFWFETVGTKDQKICVDVGLTDGLVTSR
jgi:hypothetical protein